MRYLRPGDEAKLLDFGAGTPGHAAVLSLLGIACSAYDDLLDPLISTPSNRKRILSFAKEFGIDYRVAQEEGEGFPFKEGYFDMVMAHDVIEHLHDSPRPLLIDLLKLVKEGGYLYITVPNAANIRKRIDLLRGKTNYQNFDLFYWYPGPWRGHVREYVKDDLQKLARYLDLDVLELRGVDHILHSRIPKAARPVYLAVTHIFDGWKDTWQLVAKKQPLWAPRERLSEEETHRLFAATLSLPESLWQ